jgi:ATP-dependent protease ClpP protease subunit
MYQVYGEHTKLKAAQLKEMLKNNMGGDLYLSVQDVIKYGFADEIVELNPWPKKLAPKHVPKHMRKKGKVKWG